MLLAQAIALLLAAYALGGLLFAAAFLVAGLGRIDPQARGASLGFRLIIAPGVAAFWPLLLRRWLQVRS